MSLHSYFICTVLVMGLLAGCSSSPSDPLVCAYGIEWIKESRDLGRCYHDSFSELFEWKRGAATFAVKACPIKSEKGEWKTMENLDRLIARGESIIEKWLGEFETHPFQSGLKALLVFILIRFVYRKLLK